LLALVWIDVNPASDLVQITAAMITILIVHINLQHFRDRTTPLPTLLSLGDWIRTLAQEPGPTRVGKIAIPEWTDSRQKSNAVKLIRETFDGAGHLAFRSSTTLVFYERVTNDDTDERDRQPHLTLQTITGGAANRAEIVPAPLANGREALDRIIAEEWTPPIDEAAALPDSPEVLKSAFFAIFPDGIVLDMDTREGTRDVRQLEQGVLAGILPTAMKSLDQGAVVTAVSGRWISPIFHQGKLRLIFVLPPEFASVLFRRWRRTVNTWHSVGRTLDVSHAHNA
jgi:hypothetical protein